MQNNFDNIFFFLDRTRTGNHLMWFDKFSTLVDKHNISTEMQCENEYIWNYFDWQYYNNHRGHSNLKKSFKQNLFMFNNTIQSHTWHQIVYLQNPEPYTVNNLFTSSADFLINFLAASSQIAGTVNTQWISPSCNCGTRSWKFRNRWSFKNFIPPLNTWIAGNSLPVLSRIVVFSFKFCN